jgi:hypothetical protein
MHYHLILWALTDVILFLLLILYGYVRIIRGRYLPRFISTIQIGWRQPFTQSTAQRHFVSGTAIATQLCGAVILVTTQGGYMCEGCTRFSFKSTLLRCLQQHIKLTY